MTVAEEVRKPEGRPAPSARSALLPVLAVACALAAMALRPSGASALISLCAGCCAALTVAHRGLRLDRPSSTLVILFGSVAIGGRILWDSLNGEVGTGASNLPWTPGISAASWNAYSVAVVGVAIGASVVPIRAFQQSWRLDTLRATRLPTSIAYAAGFVPIALAVVVAGTDLYQREDYLFLGSGSLRATIVGTLTLPGVVASGWLAAQLKPIGTRVVGACLLCGYSLLFMSMASRRAALIPMLVLLGSWLAGRVDRVGWRAAIIVSTSSLVFWSVPLSLRSNSEHGLIPYLASGISLRSVLGADPLKQLAANFFFSYPLTGYTSTQTASPPPDHLKISFHPGRGIDVGWYDLAPELRFNPVTPFNTIGELAWHSPWLLFAYFAVVGAVFGFAGRVVTRARANDRHLSAIAPIAVALLFSLSVLQYNLRSSTRLLMLLVVVCGLMELRQMRRGPSGNRPPVAAPGTLSRFGSQ